MSNTSYKPFSSGQTVATPGVLETVNPSYMRSCLMRHLRGDWGLCCPEDWAENDLSSREGFRILSAYPVDPSNLDGKRFWIITEANRSTTTFLLPEEY